MGFPEHRRMSESMLKALQELPGSEITPTGHDFFSQQGEWSEACAVETWPNMPCPLLRFKREDAVLQKLAEIFALTATDAFGGCLNLLHSFITFTQKPVTTETRSCPYEPWDNEYFTDACCNPFWK